MSDVVRFASSRLLWLGLVISAIALALALRGLHWHSVKTSIASADYRLLSLAVLVLLAAVFARALRWGVLFSPVGDLRKWHLLGALNVGYALNNLFPLRVGELARVYVLCRKEPVSAGRALSTIVVERTIDTITVVGLLLVVLPFIDAPAWARGPALLVGLGFLGIAMLLAVASRFRSRVLILAERLLRPFPGKLADTAMGGLHAALDGFAVVARPSILAWVVSYSVISWMLSALVMFIVMRAFGLHVPFTAGMFIMSATALAMVVPSTPGHIGVFHAIATESLVTVFGVDRDGAASFALVQHAILYLTPIAMAAIYVVAERDTLASLRRWRPTKRGELGMDT